MSSSYMHSQINKNKPTLFNRYNYMYLLGMFPLPVQHMGVFVFCTHKTHIDWYVAKPG